MLDVNRIRKLAFLLGEVRFTKSRWANGPTN
jgi:hypothetical protein